MRYRLYNNTEKAWDAMYQAIQEAQHSIVWECYIILDDTPSHRFFNLLAAKARAGVRVKIVLDSYGTLWKNMSSVEKNLRTAGAEVLYFNRLMPWSNGGTFRNWWFTRNHRKVLVIDEKVGFVGGVNVAEEYRKWLDLHLRVEGRLVKHLLRSFARTYKAVGGADPAILLYLHGRTTPWGRLTTRYIAQDPARRRTLAQAYYRAAFRKAKERITIVTPYFAPHRWFLDALSKARERGVMVEILIPRNSEHRFFTAVNRVFACAARHRGIRVLLLEKMNHAKAIVVDGVEGMVGSTNIDANSLDNNWEANLTFRRRDLVRRLDRTIEHWKQSARDFDCEGLHQGWLQWAFQGLVGAIHSFL